MLGAHLKRGVKAGAVAGLAFGLFVALVANPLVGVADAVGQDRAADGHHDGAAHESDAAAGGSHHEGAVSPAVTDGVSVLAGVLWGILLGGVVFGVAFYVLEPAIPGTGATKSYLLAAAGFVTVSGVPWLALPPLAPGVERAVPAETRLLLYAGMMAAGAVVCLTAGLAYGRLRPARGRVTAGALAMLPFSLLVVPAALSPASAPAGSLPPGLAAGLTGTVVFGQALLWTVLASVHAHVRRRAADASVAGVATAETDGALAGD